MDEGDTVTFASGAAYGALLVGRYGYGAVTGADRSDRAGSACSEEEAWRAWMEDMDNKLTLS